ncbi:Far3p Ecym_5434 [Eremothecium cymbalariae DBVPG|uniref:Uncharacterized protein n=1 Tax=Eremothecium cymbalariae (strain CBS 270.75 / DBVPG 7215 / KCTC 17166 / NRRL Y-17582) TaxID=931890 RepID=I6NDP4_ERECY|nr:hypothetical protein Ecym_5434 [Eremothecium cymbalariae DBVPG\
MDTFSDSFDYILQLTKTLSSQSWNNRQETLKIERLLKRLAKQTYIPYEQFIIEPSEETKETYNQLSKQSEEEYLIKENYKLIYLIEQQEYLDAKLWTLISQINELIVSIRNFIIEQKSARPKAEFEFIEKNLIKRIQHLNESEEKLRSSKETSIPIVEMLLKELVITCSEIDWKTVPQGTKSFQRLLHRIKKVEETHNVTLIPPI